MSVESVERARLKRYYDITLEEFNELLEKQGGKCAICSKDSKKMKRKLDIDHDHLTGVIRGLLCRECNTALGLFKDDRDSVRKAIAYLEDFYKGWK